MTFLGHFERRIDLWILLGFDHEPALIAVGSQARDDGGEVERAVAGHSEGPLDDSVEKALPRTVQLIDDAAAYVFGVHVADAPVMLVDDAQHVAAGESHMTG